MLAGSERGGCFCSLGDNPSAGKIVLELKAVVPQYNSLPKIPVNPKPKTPPRIAPRDRAIAKVNRVIEPTRFGLGAIVQTQRFLRFVGGL